MQTLQGCQKCGFPIEYRPNLYSENGVCGACINAELKKNIDFASHQEWLTAYLESSSQKHTTNGVWRSKSYL